MLENEIRAFEENFMSFPQSCVTLDRWQTLKSAVLSQPAHTQLKAEIAAFANELSDIHIKDCDVANVKDLVERMRQLSAV